MAFSPAARRRGRDRIGSAGDNAPEAAMNATLPDRSIDSLQRDFADACTMLSEARDAQKAKDTPAARLQVELCWARVDALLDDWNQALGSDR
jgi:hypothetical protein